MTDINTIETESQDRNIEEIEKELVSDYLRKTSRTRAVDKLLHNIDSIHQGYCPIWKTGITNLDELLDGGLRAKQLICLGAIPSLGKSSLVLQMADYIARSGRDVLYISLEMDSDELLAKSISRETYLLSLENKTLEKYRLTTSDILSGRVGERLSDAPERKHFNEALERVREADEHLFYFIGRNDVNVDVIENAIKSHQKARNQSPIVFVDYLQILRPSNGAKEDRLTDKRLLTDDDVTRLKNIARDCKVPVVVISAFNRDAYLNPVSSSSFRESSGIEYSADVLIGMQYVNCHYQKIKYRDKKGRLREGYESKQTHETRVRDLFDKMDNSEIRPVELKVLKVRNGRKGSSYLDFVAPYNYYACSGTSEKPPKEWTKYNEDESDDDTDTKSEEIVSDIDDGFFS